MHKVFFPIALIILSTISAQAQAVYYTAIYIKGGAQITLNAQPSLIPVPHVGALIEVRDGPNTISGVVSSVYHTVIRQADGSIETRFFQIDVHVR